MEKYKTEYKDYSGYVGIMISTDRSIFLEKSAVRARMIEHAKLYKYLHIIIFSLSKFEQTDISGNCSIYSTNSFSKLQYVSGARKVGKKILKKLDKETPVIFTCQDPFETGLAGKSLACLRKNSELLLQIHTDLFSPYFTTPQIGLKNALLNRVRLFISKFTLPQADVVRVVSVKIADSLVERGIAAEKIIIKPIAVKTISLLDQKPAFELHEKFPQFRKIILTVSRLEAEKNIEMALDAMKVVLASVPDAGLVIVGSGSKMQSLKRHAYRLKIEASVAFVGWQTDLIPYYGGCDIFLMTSWYEGYGLVLKEAQSMACSLVSTDVGIAKEVGAHIVEYTPKSIADGIIKSLHI